MQPVTAGSGSDTLLLDPVAAASRTARHWVQSRLEDWALEPLGDAVALLTSEVVTNAVLHAGTALLVVLRRAGPGVRVSVRDGSTVPPSRRRHASTSTLGRGLGLLDTLADEWGWQQESDGKTVWFRVERAREVWPDPVDVDLGDLFDGPDPAHAGDREEHAPGEVSALGRYAAGGQDAADVQVQLLAVPVQLLVAGREHHDTLVRELRLLALSDTPAAGDLPVQLVNLIETFGRQFAAARARRDEEVDAALERGLPTLDQTFAVSASAGATLQQVSALLDDADRLCEQRVLMTLPRPPLLREFAAWYLAQVVGQLHGRPPEPWTGPLRLPPRDGPSTA